MKSLESSTTQPTSSPRWQKTTLTTFHRWFTKPPKDKSWAKLRHGVNLTHKREHVRVSETRLVRC